MTVWAALQVLMSGDLTQTQPGHAPSPWDPCLQICISRWLAVAQIIAGNKRHILVEVTLRTKRHISNKKQGFWDRFVCIFWLKRSTSMVTLETLAKIGGQLDRFGWPLGSIYVEKRGQRDRQRSTRGEKWGSKPRRIPITPDIVSASPPRDPYPYLISA